ncbi:MAG TPA: cystathionine gamma-synthase [Planctomycetes bacterium]|nr:cystathionine gamma-synthase [Planctomycetota bacterium]
MEFETRAIHVGQEPEAQTGAVVVPIFQTSTYAQPDVGVHKGHEYSRTSNPTRDALQTCIASLEGGRHGFAFSSGMGAIGSLMTLFEAGDRVLCSDDVYGGTFRLFDKIFKNLGLVFDYVDMTDLDAVAAKLEAGPRLVWVESPTNPMLKICDISAIARLCHDRGALLGVDNTFMSPFFQRPLELGADIVMHSATKYLGGHSDVVGGILVVADDGLAERIAFAQNSFGAIPGPMDSWLLLRGLKTLALRMERHQSNATAVARHLAAHPRVREVIYPGLENHPGHALQKEQGHGFGGMISLRLDADLEGTKTFCRATQLFFLAESLGGVESLLEHPAIMTHASVPPETRQALGITDNFVRLSVGIESREDLLADLDQALDQMAAS